MAYRTILLELVDDAQNEARIRCGLQLAERFEAELVAIHVSLPPMAPVGYGEGNAFIGPEMFEAQREANRLVRERVEAAFRRACERARLPARDLYDEGDPGDILAEAARTVDLMVAAQAGGGFEAAIRHPIDQVILSAGGPVLMLPRASWTEPLGRRVVVAWNGSREAARALKDALPFLVTAEAVTVAAAGEAATVGPGGCGRPAAAPRRHGDGEPDRARPAHRRHAARGRGRRPGLRPPGHGRLRPLPPARGRARRRHPRGATRRRAAGAVQLLSLRGRARAAPDEKCGGE